MLLYWRSHGHRKTVSVASDPLNEPLALNLSLFDAAPFIAFTAPKKIDHGIETDGRISVRIAPTSGLTSKQVADDLGYVDVEQVDYSTPRHRRGVERGFETRPRK